MIIFTFCNLLHKLINTVIPLINNDIRCIQHPHMPVIWGHFKLVLYIVNDNICQFIGRSIMCSVKVDKIVDKFVDNYHSDKHTDMMELMECAVRRQVKNKVQTRLGDRI